MSFNETTTREDLGPDDQDSETAGAITVNLTEKDPAKAIERSELAFDDEGNERPRNSKERRNDLQKDLAKRFGRIERSFDQRLAESEALHQRELRERDKRIEALETKRVGADTSADEATHIAKIADLESQLADALETGESKKVAKLQSTISQEHARFASAQTAKLMGGQQERRTHEDENTKQAGPSQMGRRFLAANADWWNDPANRRKKLAAIDIDSELMTEGFDPNTTEYYEELQSRFNDEFPDFEMALPGGRRNRRQEMDDEDDEDTLTQPRNRRQAVRQLSASINRGAGQPTSRNGRVVLNKSDISTMEQFGLDPSNQEHVLAFAAEKRA